MLVLWEAVKTSRGGVCIFFLVVEGWTVFTAGWGRDRVEQIFLIFLFYRIHIFWGGGEVGGARPKSLNMGVAFKDFFRNTQINLTIFKTFWGERSYVFLPHSVQLENFSPA